MLNVREKGIYVEGYNAIYFFSYSPELLQRLILYLLLYFLICHQPLVNYCVLSSFPDVFTSWFKIFVYISIKVLIYVWFSLLTWRDTAWLDWIFCTFYFHMPLSFKKNFITNVLTASETQREKTFSCWTAMYKNITLPRDVQGPPSLTLSRTKHNKLTTRLLTSMSCEPFLPR